jgi:Flp pilus assembly pilin Flp
MQRNEIGFGADSERGAGLAEYALLLGMVLVACVAVLGTLGGTIAAALNTAVGLFG